MGINDSKWTKYAEVEHPQMEMLKGGTPTSLTLCLLA